MRKTLTKILFLVSFISGLNVQGQECKSLLDSLDKMISSGNTRIGDLLQYTDSVCLKEVGSQDSLYGGLLNVRGIYLLTTGDIEGALSYFHQAKTKLVKIFGQNESSVSSVYSNESLAYFYSGRFQEALAATDTSMMIKREIGDTTSFNFGNTLLTRAGVLLRLGRIEEAKSDMMLSWENAKVNYPQKDAFEYLNRINFLGVIYTNRLEDWEAGIKLLMESVETSIILFGEEDERTIKFMNNLAYGYSVLRKFSAAEKYGEKALSLAEKIIPNQPLTNTCRQNLGVVFTEQGKYAKALKLLMEAKKIEDNDPKFDPTSKSLLLNNLGKIYLEITDYASAILYFTEARQHIASFDRKSPQYALVNNNLATCHYQMGNTELAEALALESFGLIDSLGESFPDYEQFSLNTLVFLQPTDSILQRFNYIAQKGSEKFGSHSPKYGAFLTTYGVKLGDAGHFKESLAVLQQAEEILRPRSNEAISNDYIGLIRDLGTCHEKLGHRKKAQKLYQKALMLAQKNLEAKSSFVAFLQTAIADLKATRGKQKSAFAHYVEAASLFKELTDQNFAVLSDAGRESFQSSINSEIERWYTFAWRNADRFQQIPGLLFDDELSRKGQLLYSARTVLAHLYASGDSILARQFEQWRDHKQVIANHYSLDPKERFLAHAEIDSINNEVVLAETKLVQNSRTFSSARKQVNWREVRDNLAPDAAAIEFIRFRYQEGLHVSDSVFYAALILRPGYRDPVFVRLFEEKELAGRLTFAAQAGQIKDYTGQLYFNNSPLYQFIWQPLETQLEGVNTIWYAPTGLLHRVAFGALTPQSDQPLIKKYDLQMVESTREVVFQNPGLGNSVQTALFVGDIRYDADSLCLTQEKKDQISLLPTLPIPFLSAVRGGCQSDSISALPGSKREIESLFSMLQSRMYIRLLAGCQAREEEIKLLGHKKRSPDILHFATHGFFCDDPEISEKGSAPDRPPLFRSGIFLAGAAQVLQKGNPFKGMEDGHLYAYEVSHLNLTGTKLVILSACETALGDIRGSEGVYGLPRAFRLAGAGHVIMSLWRINDEEAAQFMETFYRHWSPKTDIRTAFLATQRELQAMGKRKEAWAAFILM